MSEKVMLSGRVPEDLKRLVDADPRDNQEIMQAALWREFGGERMAVLDRRIDEKERRISMIESEKNERERELQSEKEELEALRAKKDSALTQEEQDRQEVINRVEVVSLKSMDQPYVPDDSQDLEALADEAGMSVEELKDAAIANYEVDN